jgi:hypothetical protein
VAFLASTFAASFRAAISQNGGSLEQAPFAPDNYSVEAGARPLADPGGRIAFGIASKVHPGFSDVQKHGALLWSARGLRDLQTFLSAFSIVGHGGIHILSPRSTHKISMLPKVFNAGKGQ